MINSHALFAQPRQRSPDTVGLPSCRLLQVLYASALGTLEKLQDDLRLFRWGLYWLLYSGRGCLFIGRFGRPCHCL